MTELVQITGLEGASDFPNITEQQKARILNRALYWMSGKGPTDDCSFLQARWSEYADKNKLTAEQKAEDLPIMLQQLINSAYQQRGRPIISVYRNIRSSAPNETIDDPDEARRLRETLAPQLLPLLERMERGEVDPRDVLATAMAIGTLSNDTNFRMGSGDILTPAGQGYAGAAIADAYSVIDRGAAIPERFNRDKTVADILREKAQRGTHTARAALPPSDEGHRR
ncbi:MAG TPA: hypothetical protein VFT64_06810 [Rickettsiales bacterium]|nr:hypothetical protein [Rickettsiales bacterium]